MRIFLLCVVVSLLPACESLIKKVKHTKSSVIGLNRKVTLMSCHDGSKIRGWEGRFMVEVKDGVASWIDDNDREVKIAGCFVIEEV